MADFMARMVIRNALFLGRDKVSSLLVPWATYTAPEVAHVGLYERDLEARGIAFATYTRELADVDRAILEDDTEGFVRIHVKQAPTRFSAPPSSRVTRATSSARSAWPCGPVWGWAPWPVSSTPTRPRRKRFGRPATPTTAPV